ncbi:hypothetical protein [Halonotius pteroides]|uniref:Uncharacterized protein n=1 Tax=Halonotius pteroides TaxID=268735 RepID=A0A3A6PYN3_9EURY|nr:hypothetical protein [Halonotius pteroides]RJX47487.1 hypothetical protein DP106_14770 [Halonotius pteroides]
MSQEPDPRSTRGPHPPDYKWPEYRQLEEAVEAYLDHDADDPRYDNIWRALGAILGGYQRDVFIDAFDLAEPADSACIRRLITGDGECSCSVRSWKKREREKIGDLDEPPHSPPHSDHATLWLDENGNPAMYGMHLYMGNVEQVTPSKTADPDQRQRNGWFDIVNWAAEWGLEVSFMPKSWYHLGTTVHVVIYPPERRR